MSSELPAFQTYQAAFAARIRAPRQAPRPPGASARRMKVYEELLFNNLEGFLLACYPVTRRILGARAWKRTVQAFFAEHPSHSPLFRDIPKAFLDWIETRTETPFPVRPFLTEFMHYEWLELAVSIDPEEIDPPEIDPDGDLLGGHPALNPTARLACYHYPVHRIGPRHQPKETAPHCYLLFRDETDAVRFELINPLTTRLLDLLRQEPISGHEALARLAAEAAAPQLEAFIAAGFDLLRQLRNRGALAGTWRTP